MYIDSITTRNFMGLKNVHIVTSGAKVNLFAGPNESRKSSVKDAIRIAWLGTSPRVRLKKDHSLLVTDGMQKGRVTIKWRMENGAEQQEMYRNIDSEGAVSPKEFKFDEYSVACLTFALQVQSFADAKLEDRKQLLTNLLEIRMSKEDILKRLKEEYKADDPRISHISPFLRSGFDAAHKEATAKQAAARAAWVALTGETWGNEKVLEWKPPEDSDLVVVTKAQMDAANSEMDELDNQIDSLVRQQATIDANQSAIERLTTERAEVTELRKQYPSLRKSRTQLTIGIDELKSDIDEQKERLANIEVARHVLSCPNCDHKLRLNGRELVPVEIDQVDIGSGDASNETVFATKLANAEADLTARQRDLVLLDQKLERAKGGEARIAAIDEELAKIAPPGGIGISFAASIADARTARATRNEVVNKMRANFAQVETRKKNLESAKEAVKAYFEWKKVTDALAADGIPGAMLMEAIKPLNKRMEASAALAGWPRVQLNKDMELVRDTPLEPMRAYSLLSKSAQWRASAVVAEAISSMAGMKILILDEMDILTAGDDRVRCMEWLKKLGEDDYHSIFVFATMKSKPTSEVCAGARVHWMPDVVLNQSTGE